MDAKMKNITITNEYVDYKIKNEVNKLNIRDTNSKKMTFELNT